MDSLNYSLEPRLAEWNRGRYYCSNCHEVFEDAGEITLKNIVAFKCEYCGAWNGINWLEIMGEE